MQVAKCSRVSYTWRTVKSCAFIGVISHGVTSESAVIWVYSEKLLLSPTYKLAVFGDVRFFPHQRAVIAEELT